MGFIRMIFRAGGIMAASLIIAALLVGYLALYHAAALDSSLTLAKVVESWISNTTNTGLSPEYNIWLQFLIDDKQLVFMFVVLVVRLVLAVGWWLIETVLLGRMLGRA